MIYMLICGVRDPGAVAFVMIVVKRWCAHHLFTTIKNGSPRNAFQPVLARREWPM
jgi:hypothetical protein